MDFGEVRIARKAEVGPLGAADPRNLPAPQENLAPRMRPGGDLQRQLHAQS